MYYMNDIINKLFDKTIDKIVLLTNNKERTIKATTDFLNENHFIFYFNSDTMYVKYFLDDRTMQPAIEIDKTITFVDLSKQNECRNVIPELIVLCDDDDLGCDMGFDNEEQKDE